MQDRRLRSAVFLTYQFDPGFFEQEVLPVFLDVPLSHAAAIRLVQIEDALRALPGQIAVYYDANGLVLSDMGPAKLDVRRVPVQHRTGIFHPKNVLLLVESETPNDDGHRAQALIIASLSANLTRSGWWENVEVCHVEEVGEGDKTLLKHSLVAFLRVLRRKAPADSEHVALSEILTFLGDTSQRLQKSAFGQLHTHFFAGREPLVDFLAQAAGSILQDTFLEIISPYFDDAPTCQPLQALIERFQPKEVRVFLPRSSAGEGLCRREIYQAIRALPRVRWSHLPMELLRLGRSADAGQRFVHAKLYRFFTQRPKREVLFVGSANLTRAAHQAGGNVETGFLVDRIPLRRPDFWLSPDEQPPAGFRVGTEDDATTASGGTPLNLRYHWDQSVAEVFWDASRASPPLRLEARSVAVGALPPLPPRVWIPLAADVAQCIAALLQETSLFLVYGDGDTPARLLVQEEGMSHKPSLLLHLSAVEILRYWSLLTPEQRMVFLEVHAPAVALLGQGADLVTRGRVSLESDTLFDRFAGFFHAFGCLERAVRLVLKSGQVKEAHYRLFGKKYDSLGSLLDRVVSEDGSWDDIDRYVVVLCARQLCREMQRDYQDFWAAHLPDAQALEEHFAAAATIRQRLVEHAPADLQDFLTWFDPWFLRRATPVEETEA